MFQCEKHIYEFFGTAEYILYLLLIWIFGWYSNTLTLQVAIDVEREEDEGGTVETFADYVRHLFC